MGVYHNRVCVLMSTYNGESYIKEQIESIMRQEQVDVSLCIRDDGSKDTTLNIIKEYMKKYEKRIMLLEGENLGFANSFMELVNANSGYDFYAFSDQDDVWEKNKLAEAISYIDTKTPMLYGSNLKAFRQDGSTYLLYNLCDQNKMLDNMNKYIFWFNPYGCTMVWNSPMQSIVQSQEKPKELTHDVWLYLVARCCGDVYFDFNSFINYRIHDNNTCGATPKGIVARIRKYYKFYFINKKSLLISAKCQAVEKSFPKCSTKLIKSLASYDKNIKDYFGAIYNVMHMDIQGSEKFKFIMLILFKKF